MTDRTDLYVIPDDFPMSARRITPAEALTVLLPDVDWEQLRALIGYLMGEEDFGAWNHDVAPLIRLLAVYDGKDE